LRLGDAYEQATPWRDRRPSLQGLGGEPTLAEAMMNGEVVQGRMFDPR